MEKNKSRSRILLKWIVVPLVLFVILSALIFYILYSLAYDPKPLENATFVCKNNVPLLKNNQRLKILSWNVQYMAGKEHVFFYDVPEEDKNNYPNLVNRPTKESIQNTLVEVAKVIIDQNPDIVLLQEVDDGAKRTDYKNQLIELINQLPKNLYPCASEAFYWKAPLVLHPNIMGSVGMKLVTLSKYKISRAIRHQLPIIPAHPIYQKFNFKRAILEVHLPLSKNTILVVLNTHYDAFAQGSDTMKKQVLYTQGLVNKFDRIKQPWLIGGDFNLLPPGNAWEYLTPKQRKEYNKFTEIAPFFAQFQSIPDYNELNGKQFAKWFTFFSNDPGISFPDRTIDYIFLSHNITIGEHFVLHENTHHISDHMPLITTLTLPVKFPNFNTSVTIKTDLKKKVE